MIDEAVQLEMIPCISSYRLTRLAAVLILKLRCAALPAGFNRLFEVFGGHAHK